MTYGYCVYHGIECDYKGSCIDCSHNTEKDTEWFKQDEERAEKGVENMSREMTNTEREARIATLEREEFNIQMNDHLSTSDYDRLKKIHEEIRLLEREGEK